MNAETNININKNKNKKKKRSPGLIAGMILVVLMIILLVTLAMFMSYDEVTNVFVSGKLDIVLVEPNWDPSNAVNIVPNAELPKDPKVYNNEVDADVFLEVTVPYVTVKIDDNNNTEKGKLLTYSGNNEWSPNGSKYVDVPLYKFMVNKGTEDNPVYDHNTDYSSPAQMVHASDANTSGWQLMTTNSSDTYTGKNENKKVYIYRYAYVEKDGEMKPMIHGTETPVLFDKIKLINFRENDSEFTFERNRDYSIKVQAYGIQAYFLAENNTTKTAPTDVWNVLQSTNGS